MFFKVESLLHRTKHEINPIKIDPLLLLKFQYFYPYDLVSCLKYLQIQKHSESVVEIF